LASLLDLGLVDELSIAVIPVLLGGGKPMVDRLRHRVPLTLIQTRTYGNGSVQLTYTVPS
ncbi:MAG TPA: dihydrofolate reductase family protein, partial [Chitinophagaceae bacterium]|nr:dihydrofolate reductase family protein [Chitinophagaceae bacterium]